MARPDWAAVLRASLVPVLSLREGGLAGALALLGTTLTSYVYVWETIQRGAEKPAEPAAGSRAEGSLVGGGRAGGGTAARVRAGAIASAVFTAAILWSMLVASAATLGRRHQVPVSAQDAARALRPLAGPVAADLFAAGLVISAVVALPVLMTSTAYVVGAQFDWRRGLSQPVGQARRCYAILGASVGLGVLVTLAGVPVFGMLVAASVIGGFGTPVGLVLLVRLARDRQVMGDAVISRPLALAGWMIAVVVGGLGLLCVVGAAAGRL